MFLLTDARFILILVSPLWKKRVYCIPCENVLFVLFLIFIIFIIHYIKKKNDEKLMLNSFFQFLVLIKFIITLRFRFCVFVSYLIDLCIKLI